MVGLLKQSNQSWIQRIGAALALSISPTEALLKTKTYFESVTFPYCIFVFSAEIFYRFKYFKH
jgi:hypothetical protein